MTVNRRYYIPIEENGQKKTLVLSEKLYREMLTQFTDLASDVQIPVGFKSIPIKSSSIDYGRWYDPPKPIVFDDMLSKDKFYNLTTVIAKRRPAVTGFTHITFPWLKNVIPGGIMNNPCAEIELPDSLERAIEKELMKSAERIMTPGFIADPKAYPHECPRCRAPAYVGLQAVDCSRKSCS